jgi:membrane protein
MFSAAPVLYVAIAVAGVFLDELKLSEMFFDKVAQVMGEETMIFLAGMVESMMESTSSGSWLVSLIGFIAILFAASSLFFYLQFVLNSIWKVPPPKRGVASTTTSVVRNRLITFLLVFGVGVLLAIAFALNIILSSIANYFDIGSLGIANFALMIALGTMTFAIIYKVLPNAKIAWRDVWTGALVTAVLITLGTWGLGFYLGRSHITSAFEATGAVVVFLISMYFFAQLFIFGAVFTRVYASMFGSRKSEIPPAAMQE